MASPLRARLLAAKDIKSQLETIPEWGDETGPFVVEIRGLTGTQQVECSDAATVKENGSDGDTSRVDNGKLTQLMLLKSLYDPQSGGIVLEEADADALWEKSAIVLNRLATIVMRLNGMTQEEDAAMEKNLGATTSGAGASA